MSIHTPPQFTPAQLLESGRRAESEGRIDFAIQFYRHLTDHYAPSPEAQVAREALARVAPKVEVDAASAGQANGWHHSVPALAAPTHAGWPPLQSPAEPQHRLPRSAVSLAPPMAHQHAAAHGETVHAAPSLPLPPPSSDYRTGRALARLMTWLGGLVTIVGVVMLTLALAVQAAEVFYPQLMHLLAQFGSLTGNPLLGAGNVLGGLGMMVLGQLARALMDQANATRDLAAMSRARSEDPVKAARRRKH